MKSDRILSYGVQSLCWMASILIATVPCALISRFISLGRGPEPEMMLTIAILLGLSACWATLPHWWKS